MVTTPIPFSWTSLEGHTVIHEIIKEHIPEWGIGCSEVGGLKIELDAGVVWVVFGSPVKRLEKDHNQTGPGLIRTTNNQDW